MYKTLETVRREKIFQLAEEFDYVVEFEKPENKLIRFKRDGVKIDVWYTTLTVCVFDRHDQPHYRRDNTLDDLVEVFANPSTV